MLASSTVVIFACQSLTVCNTFPANRNIQDCADEFKARNLPLHGLINNIGTENPFDGKSKEGFDVSLPSISLLSPALSILLIVHKYRHEPLASTMCIALQPTQAANYLGHFYLTHLLLEKLTDTPQSRVVNLTSLVEPNGSIEWTDIGYAHSCSTMFSALGNYSVLPNHQNCTG